MHQKIKQITKIESSPLIIKKILTRAQIKKIQHLYKILPIEINNKRQKIIKKKWISSFCTDIQKILIKKIKKKIGNFKLNNPKNKNGLSSFGLFQESYKPVNLHADTGFEFHKIIFKQFLLPLSSKGETVIFKNRFYGCSTTFSIDPRELEAKGYNKRSSEHLKIFKGKEFDKKKHKKYLKHESLENLTGLEIDMVYKWELGSMLIFDRTRLHCSSSLIDWKKIGLTTFTKK